MTPRAQSDIPYWQENYNVIFGYKADWQYQGPLLLTWINFNPSMDK